MAVAYLQLHFVLDCTGVARILVILEICQRAVCRVTLKILKPKKTCWIN